MWSELTSMSCILCERACTGLPHGDPLPVIIIVVLLIWTISPKIASVLNFKERAIAFKCHPPEALRQPAYASLEVLKKPTITVPGSTAIQCYAPASGKALGRVNPVTADGIDRAVKKAAEAQKVWRATPWTLRRKVLKTLLKYVFAGLCLWLCG